MTTTDTVPEAGLRCGPQLRPHHYQALELGYDHDHDECDLSADCVRGVYLVEAFGDEADAREYVELQNDVALFPGDWGLFDNWTGEWLIEPSWVEEYDVRAEGFARLDLRPVGAR